MLQIYLILFRWYLFKLRKTRIITKHTEHNLRLPPHNVKLNDQNHQNQKQQYKKTHARKRLKRQDCCSGKTLMHQQNQSSTKKTENRQESYRQTKIQEVVVHSTLSTYK